MFLYFKLEWLSLYSKQAASSASTEVTFSKSFKVTNDVYHGGIMSPILFKVYMGQSMYLAEFFQYRC